MRRIASRGRGCRREERARLVGGHFLGTPPCSNKGDRQSPDVRARWCAKEVATYKSDAFFAATPPLEAMRLILSEAASQGRRRGRELKVQLLDAKNASDL